jgi:hypothetical protein
MHLCVFFNLASQFIELVLEVFSIEHNLLVLVCQIREVFLQPDYLLSDKAQLTFIVFSAHFMFGELS